MTVPAAPRRAGPFNGDGVNLVFPFDFKVFDEADVRVVELDVPTGVESDAVLNSDYTVALNPDQESNPGGTVNYIVAPASTKKATLIGDLEYEQPVDLPDGGNYRAQQVEDALDRLSILVQQLKEITGRCAQIPVSSEDAQDLFESINVLSANIAGLQTIVANITDLVTLAGVSADVSTLAPVAGDIANLVLALDGAEPDGSAFVTFIQSGGGAVVRTVQSKARERKTPADFGAVGDGVADDTAELQALFLAHLDVDLGGPDKSYRVSGLIPLRTGHDILGRGATITQVTANTEIFNLEGKSDITCEGVRFVGLGSDYNESDSLRAAAFYGGVSGARLRIVGNHFTNFGYTAARFKDQDDIYFCDNIVVGPGAPTLTPITSGRNYGVLFDSVCEHVTCTGNTISKHAQGVRIEQCLDSRIANNVMFDIVGQHGVYAGPNTNLVIEGNTIRNVDLVGIKVQAQQLVGECLDVAIVGNTIVVARGDGILLCNSSGSAAQTNKVRNVTVVGNTVRDTTAVGINVQNVAVGVISSNVIRNALTYGVNLSACSYVTVDGNQVQVTNLSGIRDEAGNDNTIISNNRLHNVAQSSTVGDEYGIYLNAGSSYIVHGNIISDNNAKMEYGIFATSNLTQSGCEVYNNTVLNAVFAGGRFDAAQSMRRFSGNFFASGSNGPIQTPPSVPTVASAATITLPGGAGVVFITGTTGITSIVGGRMGEIVTLVFSDALTVTRGGALLLNAALGNFVATGGDTLTLAFTGATQCYEVSRSAN